MNEIKSNEWLNWKLSYSSYSNYLNVMCTLNFHEKYIKFYVHVHKYIFFSHKYIKFIMSWD